MASQCEENKHDKPIVYQEELLHPELQQMIDENFTIVWPDQVDKFRKKIVALLVCKNPSPVNGELLDKFPAVKVVGKNGVGYDAVDVGACKARGIRIGNTPGTLNDTTADMAFALLLATARRVCEGDHICRDPATKSFDLNSFGYQVSGQVMGIVGLGRIGMEVAKRGRAFSMTVLYHNRRQCDGAVEKELSVSYIPSLHELLQKSDFVVVVVPGSKENVKLFGKTEFAAMKRSAVFINVSRGVVVDQDALVAALSSNQIAAAGLDVTTPEPLPRDHPLLSLSNVTITPHWGKLTEILVDGNFKVRFWFLVRVVQLYITFLIHSYVPCHNKYN